LHAQSVSASQPLEVRYPSDAIGISLTAFDLPRLDHASQAPQPNDSRVQVIKADDVSLLTLTLILAICNIQDYEHIPTRPIKRKSKERREAATVASSGKRPTSTMAEAYQKEFFNVSFPTEYVAHVEINRPEKLNAFKEV